MLAYKIFLIFICNLFARWKPLSLNPNLDKGISGCPHLYMWTWQSTIVRQSKTLQVHVDDDYIRPKGNSLSVIWRIYNSCLVNSSSRHATWKTVLPEFNSINLLHIKHDQRKAFNLIKGQYSCFVSKAPWCFVPCLRYLSSTL